MKDKQFDPARNNEKAPAEGMAAVNTHNPGEEPVQDLTKEQSEEKEIPQQRIKETGKE